VGFTMFSTLKMNSKHFVCLSIWLDFPVDRLNSLGELAWHRVGSGHWVTYWVPYYSVCNGVYIGNMDTQRNQ
jgi:hypothetical protein